jgi:flagellar biosynthetic protein FliR
VELFQSDTAQAIGLLSTRLSGLLLVAPVFSSRAVPMRVRTGLLLLFTALLLPPALAAAQLPGGGMPRVGPATLATEVILGLSLGLGAAVFVAAAESAGDMLAVQMGLSGANVLNPISGTQMPIVGQFLGLFAMALLLASGGHLVILEVLTASLRALPPGASLDLEGGITASVNILSAQFLLGLRFAAPVVAAMMIGNAMLGVMAKTVPQLNVLMMAFPLQIGIGLLTLALSLSLIAGFFAGWPEHYADLISQVLERFVPQGGGP